MNISYPDFSAGNHNCADVDPAVFFQHGGGSNYNDAKETCQGCPMLQGCFSHALGHDIQGFWAGTNENQRKKIRKIMRVVPVTMEASFSSVFQSEFADTGTRPHHRAMQAKKWESVDLGKALAVRDQVIAEAQASRDEARARGAEYLRTNRPKPALSDDQVREIRLSTEKSGVLGYRYGVSDITIRKVRSGARYASVPA